MSPTLPRTTKALILRQSPPERSPLFHDAIFQDQPIPALKKGEVLVKINAAAFNHRELWIRKGMYPRIKPGTTFGADGAGKVVAAFDPADSLLSKRVFLTPAHGWVSDPNGPESNFGILGSSAFPPIGTFSEYVAVSRDEVIPTPAHLTDEQAAAFPLAGLTAWRAVSVLAGVQAGQNVLITGIGGGVALIAMQFCLAMGASVYVTSGSQDKIDRAVRMGAKGGASYKDAKWPAQIGAQLKKNTPARPTLDAVIDGGGAEIMQQVSGQLKHGGKVVCYGMTGSPTKITLTMGEVMRNQQLLGSMMGSRADLIAATAFISKHKIVPVVDTVLQGLESAEEGFEMMKRWGQFGKIVVRVGKDAEKARL
ncbi:NAD(P)-binding protein [Roridomyces roridus]|uniref:NAD(P)-binding protein n=1 Tax=Roridomyces roridus TaxID=1738132 RepID=A0AAD7CCX0_9AGAR|nr:NAD(P)-binding protein [Roridomyces roridus]